MDGLPALTIDKLNIGEAVIECTKHRIQRFNNPDKNS